MDRTQISTGVGLLVVIFKYLPVLLIVGSFAVFFVVPQKSFGAVLILASVLLSAIFFLIARSMGNVATVAYDDAFLYVEQASGSHQVPLQEIRALERTRTNVNERYLWSVTFDAGGPVQVQFSPKHTLWDQSFVEFVQHLREVNPDAVKSVGPVP